MSDLLILGIMGIIGGSILGIYGLHCWRLTPGFKDQQIRDLNQLVADQKKQIQGLHGKIGNINAKKMTQISVDPEEDAQGSIMEIVDSIKDQVDPRFQKLLNNPKAMEFIINVGTGLHKKHPKEVEQFISQFLPHIPSITKGISNQTKSTSVQGL